MSLRDRILAAEILSRPPQGLRERLIHQRLLAGDYSDIGQVERGYHSERSPSSGMIEVSAGSNIEGFLSALYVEDDLTGEWILVSDSDLDEYPEDNDPRSDAFSFQGMNEEAAQEMSECIGSWVRGRCGCGLSTCRTCNFTIQIERG
jgi:hypothetical protein